MNETVCVCIPSIPPRAGMLMRALSSVVQQERPADQIAVAIDQSGRGATLTRNDALNMAHTDWVAFLDDDDELLPEHLEHLIEHAEMTGADMVFPWFTVVGGGDPFPMHFGRQWSLEAPTQTTITFLVRREAALAVGGFIDPGEAPGADDSGNRAGEDFRFVIRLAQAGYRIEHLAERTWLWHHHGANLSGMSWTHQRQRERASKHQSAAEFEGDKARLREFAAG